MRHCSLGMVLVTLLVLCLSPALPVGASEMPFPDVPEEHWAYEAVAEIAEAGLVIGYPDGTYKGAQAMTRYEMAMVAQRTLVKLQELMAKTAESDELLNQQILEVNEGLVLSARARKALEEQLRNLEANTQASDEEIRTRAAELAEAIAELTAFVRDELEALGTRVAELADGERVLTGRVNALNYLLSKNQEQIENLKEELQTATGENKKALEEHVAQLRALNEEVAASLKAEVQSALQEMNKKFASMQKSIASLVMDGNHRQENLDVLNAQLAKLHNTVATIDYVTAANDELKAQLASQISEALKAVDKLGAQVGRLAEAAESADNELAQQLAEVTKKLDEVVDPALKALEEKTDANSAWAKEELRSVRTMLARMQEDLQYELQALEARVRKLETGAALKKELDEALAELAALESEIEAMEQEDLDRHMQVGQNIVDLRKKITALEEALSEQQAELEEALAQQKEEFEGALAEVEEADIQRHMTVGQNILKLQQEIAALGDELDDLGAQVDALRDDFDHSVKVGGKVDVSFEDCYTTSNGAEDANGIEYKNDGIKFRQEVDLKLSVKPEDGVAVNVDLGGTLTALASDVDAGSDKFDVSGASLKLTAPETALQSLLFGDIPEQKWSKLTLSDDLGDGLLVNWKPADNWMVDTVLESAGATPDYMLGARTSGSFGGVRLTGTALKQVGGKMSEGENLKTGAYLVGLGAAVDMSGSETPVTSIAGEMAFDGADPAKNVAVTSSVNASIGDLKVDVSALYAGDDFGKAVVFSNQFNDDYQKDYDVIWELDSALGLDRGAFGYEFGFNAQQTQNVSNGNEGVLTATSVKSTVNLAETAVGLPVTLVGGLGMATDQATVKYTYADSPFVYFSLSRSEFPVLPALGIKGDASLRVGYNTKEFKASDWARKESQAAINLGLAGTVGKVDLDVDLEYSVDDKDASTPTEGWSDPTYTLGIEANRDFAVNGLTIKTGLTGKFVSKQTGVQTALKLTSEIPVTEDISIKAEADYAKRTYDTAFEGTRLLCGVGVSF